jgi:hypothetical protein
MSGYGLAQTYGVGFGATVGEEVARLVSKGRILEVGTAATLPTGVPEITLAQLKRRFDPFFKQWWFWAITGTVVAGGAVFFIRRRRRHKSSRRHRS